MHEEIGMMPEIIEEGISYERDEKKPCSFEGSGSGSSKLSKERGNETKRKIIN